MVESGAIDDLGKEEIDALAPVSDDYPLYTRLANGQSVTVAKRLIIPRVQACIDQLNTSGADVIALLCSGAFPVFDRALPYCYQTRWSIMLLNPLSIDDDGCMFGFSLPSQNQTDP